MSAVGSHDLEALVFLNNRYHDPTLGTFTSVDPLVQTTGEPYIYGSGSPTTLSDPSGLCAADNGSGSREACVDRGKPVVGPDGTVYGYVDRPAAGTGSRVPISPYDGPIGETGSDEANESLRDLLQGSAIKQVSLDGLSRVLCGLSVMRCRYEPGGPGPDQVDKVAEEELIDWSLATAVYTCGTSASGASVTCVDAGRIPSLRKAGAVTYGHFIFCQGRCEDDLLLAHEFVHVRQYELNGDAMVGSYLYQSWLARGRDQYREGGNPYEVEAQNVQDHLRSIRW